jgi:pyruvate dehydrogenase E1 component
MIARWFPDRFTALGTDGSGIAGTRREQRGYFEMDARYIAWTALVRLAQDKLIATEVLRKAQSELEIDPAKRDPSRE